MNSENRETSYPYYSIVNIKNLKRSCKYYVLSNHSMYCTYKNILL